MASTGTYGALQAAWRRRRGFSQLQLALAAECSQRHIGFLELGRAKPSRTMVMRLVAALDLPLRDGNAMLLAAGFAPAWTETGLDAPSIAPVSAALDYMLAQQEPYPGLVVDRHWNLLRANRGAGTLVTFLLGPGDPAASVNLADALAAPNILRPYLRNWTQVMHHFLRSVAADAAADATSESAALLARLMNYPDAHTTLTRLPDVMNGPVLPMLFSKDGVELSLFTTIATLGTPQDITLQELRVESFFPTDDATREWFQGRSTQGRSAGS